MAARGGDAVEARQGVWSAMTQVVRVTGARSRAPVCAGAFSVRDSTGDGLRTPFTFPARDQFMLQGKAFSRALRGDFALPCGVDDAVAKMRVIDALFRSEKSEQWKIVASYRKIA